MKNPPKNQAAGYISPWVYRCIAWVLISVLLAIIAPYGNQIRYDFLSRLAYWGGVNALAILLAVAVRHVIQRRLRSNSLGVLMATAIVQTAIIGPTIWVVNVHVLGFSTGALDWLAEICLITLIVCICVGLIRYEVQKLRSFAEAESGTLAVMQAVPKYRPAFLDRIEPRLGGAVLRVSADDHYLHVVTTEGQGRVLMRFRDAMDDLAEVPGFRIHRSHWVAETELVKVRPEGRRFLATLASGETLPVSTAYIDDLRRAGLVEPCAIGKRTGDGPTSRSSASADIKRTSSGRSENRPPV